MIAGQLVVLIVASFLDLTYQSQVDWSYENEDKWPGVCTSGLVQSPINIVTREAVVDNRGDHIRSSLVLRGYDAVDMEHKNTGRTLKWNVVPVDDGSGLPPSGKPPVLEGGPLQGNYTLLQFHLHWLSEHAIDDRKYPLEIHFVHVKTGVPIEEALLLPDGLAVIGVMAEITDAKDNEYALEQIIYSMPELVNYTGSHGTTTKADIIDMTRMMSPNTQSYYTYAGSLTTPKCNEAVTWIVMDHPISISDTQYKILSRVNVGGTANYRNLKPSHRIVYRTPTSCASLAAPGILSLLSTLLHFSSNIFCVIKRGLCNVFNAKRRFFGLQPIKCGQVN